MGLSVISGVNASSHREAPLISQDPVADNTDVYAFTSPAADEAGTITLIANWIPAEDPAAGPTFYRFGEDVLYSIHIDNDGDAVEDVTYEWRFRNDIQNPNTILYATGVIGDDMGDEGTPLDDPDYNFRQRYDVFVVRDGERTQIVSDAILPPDNIGIATPDYEANLAAAGVYELEGGAGQTFAGQRDDAFFADIGAIFDLGQLRPALPQYQPAPRDAQVPVDFFSGYNVHTTSIQVPISELVEDEEVIGIWSTASRPKVRVFSQNSGANPVSRGRFVQVSRLGNPLVNEVVIPFGLKDTFNTLQPSQDAAALSTPDGSIPLVQDPELGRLIEQLYNIDTPEPPRNDLVGIFLTGTGAFATEQDDNFQPAEVLRLNTTTAPGDVAWPNGRTLSDDVVDTALTAVGGTDLGDGVDANDGTFLGSFPYQATPWQGYGENNDLRGSVIEGSSTDTTAGPGR
jgi:hypothetical protein